MADHGTDESMPRRLLVLGEALQAVLTTLRQRLFDPAAVAPPLGTSVLAQIELLASQFEHAVGQLEQHTQALMDEVVSAPQARDADVYRVTGRFEATLESLLHGYEMAHAMAKADDWKASYPAGLAQAMYRHLLQEILDWLTPLATALADPLAELQRRGLPACSRLQLNTQLVATAAPETCQLVDWIRQQRSHQQASGRGLLETAAIAFLGWQAGNALFGSKEDERR